MNFLKFSDDLCNNLLCVVKCGDIVLASEVMPVVQKNIKHESEYYVEFRDTITLANVSSDFRITIEVYNLLVEKKDPVNPKQGSAKKVKFVTGINFFSKYRFLIVYISG